MMPLRGKTVQIAGRLSYRAAIEEFYARNPTASMERARRATGAPKMTVQHVCSQLRAAGRIPTPPGRRDAYAAI